MENGQINGVMKGVDALVPCDKDCPQAIAWDVYYAGIVGPPIRADTKSGAEYISQAVQRVFDAGKREAKLELRRWIGV